MRNSGKSPWHITLGDIQLATAPPSPPSTPSVPPSILPAGPLGLFGKPALNPATIPGSTTTTIPTTTTSTTTGITQTTIRTRLAFLFRTGFTLKGPDDIVAGSSSPRRSDGELLWMGVTGSTTSMTTLARSSSPISIDTGDYFGLAAIAIVSLLLLTGLHRRRKIKKSSKTMRKLPKGAS